MSRSSHAVDRVNQARHAFVIQTRELSLRRQVRQSPFKSVLMATLAGFIAGDSDRRDGRLNDAIGLVVKWLL